MHKCINVHAPHTLSNTQIRARRHSEVPIFYSVATLASLHIYTCNLPAVCADHPDECLLEGYAIEHLPELQPETHYYPSLSSCPLKGLTTEHHCSPFGSSAHLSSLFRFNPVFMFQMTPVTLKCFSPCFHPLRIIKYSKTEI